MRGQGAGGLAAASRLWPVHAHYHNLPAAQGASRTTTLDHSGVAINTKRGQQWGSLALRLSAVKIILETLDFKRILRRELEKQTASWTDFTTTCKVALTWLVNHSLLFVRLANICQLLFEHSCKFSTFVTAQSTGSPEHSPANENFFKFRSFCILMRTVFSKWAWWGCVPRCLPAHDMIGSGRVSISVNKRQLSASDPEPGFHCLPGNRRDRKKSECEEIWNDLLGLRTLIRVRTNDAKA